MNRTRQVILSFNNNQYVVELGVTPKEISISRPQNTRKYTSINGYEINLSGGMGLKRVVISTFLSSNGVFGGYGGEKYSKGEIIELFKKWQDSRNPLRLIVSGTDINDAFLIEDFSQTYYEGDEDIHISLKLCQYRFAAVSLPIVEKGGQQLEMREDRGDIPDTYTIKKGDTLWAISKRFYKTPYRWGELQEKNNIKDVRKLQIGQVIRLV